ncbi:hypothetical protein [Biformimicrobium ophioploci]|uniref:DUF2306 domain-containing protein n=1 Tax=Biformimicrobium ophioploci TaxID=3036711 RepID=A0ABQ6LWW9_9GAMM|nr:hypothetical protein [Microbulbifer sp. NKW57]GMG86502.1 hypothetical protein MNKW57_08230 [Microbulbifer sp. NKW57]
MTVSTANNPSDSIISRQRSLGFFFFASLSLLVFVVAAFGLKVIVHPERLARYEIPLVVLHGLIMVAWFGLFVLQARLVQAGSIRAHRRAGFAGIMLLILMVATGIPLSYQLGRAMLFVANCVMLLTFTALFVSAVIAASRRNFEAHKRLMLMASLAVIGPAVGRVWQVLEIPEISSLLAIIAAKVLIPVSYDLKTLGSLHKATIAGVTFSVSMTALMVAIILSPLLSVIQSILFG